MTSVSRSCPTAHWSPGNPTARPRGSPATTIPPPRPATASGSAPTAPTRRWPTASWSPGAARPRTRRWTYELAEPTSTYLVTLQIGMYEPSPAGQVGVQIHAALPTAIAPPLRPRLPPSAADDEAVRQAVRTVSAVLGLHGGGHRRRPRDPARGARHVDLRRQSLRRTPQFRTADRPRTGPPVVRQFGDRAAVADIWLHEGFACYAEWLWSENSGGRSADEWARHYHHRLADSPEDLLLADPGPRDMFDDRVYKRGALTLHVLRRHLGDDDFFALLRDWTARHRHSTAFTDDFTGLAANYTRGTHCGRCGTRGCTRRICRSCDRRRRGARRPGPSPGAAWPGSAWRRR